MVVAMALAGCATNFDPRKPEYVQETYDGGQLMLVRNGVKYSASPEGLWRAVRGNHLAEEEAARYGAWKSFGLASMLFGSGFVAGADFADSQGHIAARNSLAAVGVTTAVAGLVMLLMARPHYREAIRIYNEAADGRETNTQRSKERSVPP
jgi:hypothetical protein